MEPLRRSKRQVTQKSQGLAAVNDQNDPTHQDQEEAEGYEGDEGLIMPPKRKRSKRTRKSHAEKNEESHKKKKLKGAGGITEVLPFQYEDAGHRASLGYEFWKSRHHQWEQDFMEEDLAGVVWDSFATPWVYQEPSEEDINMAVTLCDFITPSEEAGLVLDCPVEEPEEEIPLTSPVTVDLRTNLGVITINKELLCRKVPYFSKMFEGSFSEAKTNTAWLPEDHYKDVSDMMYWVLHGTLPPLVFEWKASVDDLDESPLEDNRKDSYTIAMKFSYIELYVLADKFCLMELANLIVDYIMRSLKLMSRSMLPLEDIAEIYEKVPENTGLRRLAAYSFTQRMDYRFRNVWPAEDLGHMLQTVDGLATDHINLVRLYSNSSIKFKSPEDLAQCRFHDHCNGKTCDGISYRDRATLKRPEKRQVELLGFEYLAY